MKQVLSQDVAEAHHGSFFLVRYQRILHLAHQNHHFDAIHLLSDLIEESTEPDELLALYRLWIDLLAQEGVKLPAEGGAASLPAAGKGGVTANPQLQCLYDHLQQLRAEQPAPAAPAELIYHHSWLALQGLAGLYLGRVDELRELVSSSVALLRSPYTEELDFRLAQQHGAAFKLHFKSKASPSDVQHFVATQTYFERLATQDAAGGFYDYPLMRSLVEYALKSQQAKLVATMLEIMDQLFGWTMARGLLELDRSLAGQDRAGIRRAMDGLRRHGHDEWGELAQQLGETTQRDDADQEGLLQRYHEACARYVQQLATKDLAAADVAGISQPQAHGVKTDADGTVRGARAWLCPISARGYEEHFLQNVAHKHVVLGMEDKVRRGDLVFVVRRVHEGSRLLGIYEIYFAPELAGALSIPKVLKPVQVFDHQQYPTIKLPTYDLDSSATADIRRSYGLEELLEVTADSFSVILDEIKEQTALVDDSLVIFDDKNWQYFA